MVAIHVVGNFLELSRVEFKTQSRFDFCQEAPRTPPLLEEEMLQPRAFAVLAQSRLLAEELCNRANHSNRLVDRDEAIEANSQVRIGREPAAYTQRESQFGPT